MSDSLLHHFAELEAGTISNQAKSRQSCIDRNNKDLAAGPPSRQLMLEDLPTLVEIEDLCLKQRPNRAPGLDAIPPEVCRFAAKEIAPYIHNVILKSFLWGLEPVRYKGGQLCAIWKQKNSRKLASSYRGILLAESVWKDPALMGPAETSTNSSSSPSTWPNRWAPVPADHNSDSAIETARTTRATPTYDNSSHFC